MKYLDDFMRKDGFTDGDAYPLGIYVYRDEYLKVVNFFAELIGSSYRLRAVNHEESIHNQIRMGWTCIEDEDAIRQDHGQEGAMLAAIDLAHLYNPDRYIRIEFEVLGDDMITWDYHLTDEYEELEQFAIAMTTQNGGAQ